jgi:acetylglutamate kinase
LQARIKDPGLGYTGIINKVDIKILETQLEAGCIPVVSSVSFNSGEAIKGVPLLLNVNADTAAGELAAALRAEKLIFLTDVAGVCDETGQVISKLNVKEAKTAIESGIASGGMIPKIRAGIRALESTGSIRIIDGRQEHALIKEIDSGQGGTTLLAGD